MDLVNLIADRMMFLIPLILSITVHEWAHAAMADWLGDDTARLLGRNTLNPVAHVDPVGTLLLPLLGISFGWAKPVPINPVRFRSGVRMKPGVLLVAIAGPVSNVILAGLCLAIKRFLMIQEGSVLQDSLDLLVRLNLTLALFNMLPIPPLDGSRIADAIIPVSLRPLWHKFSNAGFVLLIALFVVPMFLQGINLAESLCTTLGL